MIGHTMEEVLAALRTVRIPAALDEFAVHEIVARALSDQGISFRIEYRLAPRNRIDFLAEGGIGIECKMGWPWAPQVIRQLERYAASPEVTALILVVERTMAAPATINGKPCMVLGLNKLWGIAL